MKFLAVLLVAVLFPAVLAAAAGLDHETIATALAEEDADIDALVSTYYCNMPGVSVCIQCHVRCCSARCRQICMVAQLGVCRIVASAPGSRAAAPAGDLAGDVKAVLIPYIEHCMSAQVEAYPGWGRRQLLKAKKRPTKRRPIKVLIPFETWSWLSLPVAHGRMAQSCIVYPRCRLDAPLTSCYAACLPIVRHLTLRLVHFP